MKIDPTIQGTSDLQSDAVKSSKSSKVRAQEGKSETLSAVVSGDTFQVSGTQAEVQQLTGQMAHVPEVRAERVEPLKAAVEQGTYQPDSQRVADAMLADQASRSAKA